METNTVFFLIFGFLSFIIGYITKIQTETALDFLLKKIKRKCPGKAFPQEVGRAIMYAHIDVLGSKSTVYRYKVSDKLIGNVKIYFTERQ